MRADNSHHLIAAARQRAEQARERAEEAIDGFHRDGRPVSVAGLARDAGVSRSWLYNQPDLLERLEQHNQMARKPRQGPAPRASDSSLLRRLEISHQRIRQLTADNQRLRDQLAKAHGALRHPTSGLSSDRSDKHHPP